MPKLAIHVAALSRYLVAALQNFCEVALGLSLPAFLLLAHDFPDRLVTIALSKPLLANPRGLQVAGLPVEAYGVLSEGHRSARGGEVLISASQQERERR